MKIFNKNFNTYRDLDFWIMFVVLFSSGFTFFKQPFEFYFHYVLFVPLIPALVLKYGFPKEIIKLLFVPLIIGVFHVALDNNNSFTFFKIFGGIFLTTLFYFGWIRHFNFNVFKIFECYCLSCWLLVVVALFQIFSYFINFKYGYDYTWFLNKWGLVRGGIIGFRVNSILSEPTYLATVISPALYISIQNLISKKSIIFSKTQSILIIVVSILTTSTIGYLGILISFILCTNTIRLRYVFFGALFSIIGFTIAYNNVSDFKSRANSAKGLWVDKDFGINNTNNSSFVLYNNLHIASENLMHYPIFGTGLGSHEKAFKNYSLTNYLIQYDFEFNIKDGNSLFVRLCTETGLLGVCFILFFVFKFFIYKTDNNDESLLEHKMVSQSLFVLLVLVLIRQGNYMLNGLPMLFLLYYYNGRQYKEKIISIEKT